MPTNYVEDGVDWPVCAQKSGELINSLLELIEQEGNKVIMLPVTDLPGNCSLKKS